MKKVLNWHRCFEMVLVSKGPIVRHLRFQLVEVIEMMLMIMKTVSSILGTSWSYSLCCQLSLKMCLELSLDWCIFSVIQELRWR